MNESKLNPDNTPTGLSENPDRGVVRLNSLPMVLVGVVLLVVVIVLFYAGYQRTVSKSEEADFGLSSSEKIERAEAQGEDGWVNKLTNRMLKSGEKTEASEQSNSQEVVNSNKGSPTSATNQVSGRGQAEQTMPTGGAATEEEKRIQDRVNKFREDSFFDAVVASTSVRFQSQNNKGNNTSKAQPGEVPLNFKPADNTRTERLQQLLQAAGGGQASDTNMQEEKQRFQSTERRYGYSSEMRVSQLTPYELRVGTVIPAVMVGGINSDLPGEIIAQVSQNVRDTRSGQFILIPQGSRLIGSYSSNVAMGQERVMVGWHRLQFPDGSTMEIGNMGGVDQAGYAGFKDKVNNHYLRIFGNATLLSVISAAAQLSQPEGRGTANDAREELSAELGRQWGQVGQEMTRRNMQIQPTLEIRPGYKFNVMVNKDLILNPY